LKCEFMQGKLGEKFDGIITSVNSFGIFVELDEVHVDGLVHITALDNDFYHFDPIGHRLHGERTGTVYRLGDPLRVQVAAVNLDDRKIDFVLAEPSGKGGKSGQGGKGGQGRPGPRTSKQKEKARPIAQADQATAPAPAAQTQADKASEGVKKPRSRNRRKRKPTGAAPTS
ncbi:MAG: S1 RNA-binding domain-containing protein, partial [Gammaproteobacteria bacterium]|nr:S1 RNA-binding domain-containing protein [Gammaproteobacteria bacterium]